MFKDLKLNFVAGVGVAFRKVGRVFRYVGGAFGRMGGDCCAKNRLCLESLFRLMKKDGD